MEVLLGHGRGRGAGVEGHNSFEVYLTDPQYAGGKWVLLDHDLSTVIFDSTAKSLLSIFDVTTNLKQWTSRGFAPEKQHGWLVCGLDQGDGTVYGSYSTAELLPGYASVPPIVHLRRGETFRRYLKPGLEDGKTFAFWGRNYNTAGIRGPERSITWVNQPEKMHGSRTGAGYKPGQARYANAVYVYRPDFRTSDYREGVVDESEDHVTFEFYTPYIIAATPPNDKPWGIYEEGCRNGLRVEMPTRCKLSVSVDQGKTWQQAQASGEALDLTDYVKGRRQYFLRFDAPAKELNDVTIRTVCQANVAVLPRLKDNGCHVSFDSSKHAVISAGPNKPQAAAHIVAGAFDTSKVTLEVSSPRGEPALSIYAAAHIASGNPPSPQTKYQIDYSTDNGASWLPLVKDWSIPRLGEEPSDFWSQSFCYGSTNISSANARSVQVRFRNDGGKQYLRAEAHLIYGTSGLDATKVTFAWKDKTGEKSASHVFDGGNNSSWRVDTGTSVETRWVELEVGR